MQYAAVAGFSVAIAGAQMLLFGGKQPRKASIVAGHIACPIVAAATVLAHGMVDPGKFSSTDPTNFIGACLAAAMAGLVFGGAAGYVAGGLMAGVFLFGRGSEEPPQMPPGADTDP